MGKVLMQKSDILRRVHDGWLCMIMRGDTADETLQTCEALIAGGATLIEAAFTTPNVCDVIRELRKRHGDKIVLSAGTVLTPEQAHEAVDSGAQVVVSPDFNPEVVKVAVERGVLSMPGCFTPTEIRSALRSGADIIKLFPCYPVGPEYISYMHGPFPGVPIMPAGAVTLSNMRAYADAGAFGVVVGVTTEMQLRDAITAGCFEEVTAAARFWLARMAEIQR